MESNRKRKMSLDRWREKWHQFFLFFLLFLPWFQKWFGGLRCMWANEIFCLVDHFWNMVKEKKRKKKKRRVGGNFNVWEIELAFEEREKCWNMCEWERLRSKHIVWGKRERRRRRKFVVVVAWGACEVMWLGDWGFATFFHYSVLVCDFFCVWGLCLWRNYQNKVENRW